MVWPSYAKLWPSSHTRHMSSCLRLNRVGWWLKMMKRLKAFKWDFYNFLKQDNWSRQGRRREPAGGTRFPGKETRREGNSRRQEATPEPGRESLMTSSPASADANEWTARHVRPLHQWTVTCARNIWKRMGPSQLIKCFLQRAELLLVQQEVMWQICSTIPNYREPKMYCFRQEQHHSQPAL